MKKKVLLFSLLLCVGLSACGKKAEDVVYSQEPAAKEQTEETVAEETPEAEQEQPEEETSEDEEDADNQADEQKEEEQDSDENEMVAMHDYSGFFTDGMDDDMTLTRTADGGYDVEISIFRLCSLVGTGNDVDGACEVVLTDPANNKMSGIVYVEENGTYTFKVTESTWTYLSDGDSFTGFQRSEAGTAENPGTERDTNEIVVNYPEGFFMDEVDLMLEMDMDKSQSNLKQNADLFELFGSSLRMGSFLGIEDNGYFVLCIGAGVYYEGEWDFVGDSLMRATYTDMNSGEEGTMDIVFDTEDVRYITQINGEDIYWKIK